MMKLSLWVVDKLKHISDRHLELLFETISNVKLLWVKNKKPPVGLVVNDLSYSSVGSTTT